MIEDGSFRQDLYYRINVFPIHLPPLRKRSDDILALCNHFLRKFARENAHPPIRLSNEAMDLLQIYDWPGNIRELENVMIRAVMLAGHDSSIQVHHIPPHIQNLSRTPPTATLPETIERIEKEAITQAMQQSEGKRSKDTRHHRADAWLQDEEVLTLVQGFQAPPIVFNAMIGAQRQSLVQV